LRIDLQSYFAIRVFYLFLRGQWRGKLRAPKISEFKKVSDQENNDQEFKIWMCIICGWMYEEEKGCPEEGIAPGTLWENVADDWFCPDCGAGKDDFEMIEV
jgi:rubredoxin